MGQILKMVTRESNLGKVQSGMARGGEGEMLRARVLRPLGQQHQHILSSTRSAESETEGKAQQSFTGPPRDSGAH